MTLAVGVNYVVDLEEAVPALTSALKPGGGPHLNVPLLNNRGPYLRPDRAPRSAMNQLVSLEKLVALAERVGLQGEMAAPAGLSWDDTTGHATRRVC